MATTSPPPSFPAAFGRYILLRKIARGGMAELFLAKSPERRDPVVIKRVLPNFDGETEFLEMFVNEARIASQLHHPNIAQVFDLGQENGQLYLAMEYIDGLDLEVVLKAADGRIPPHLAARIGADVCSALFSANTTLGVDGKPLNVVHRDVTPGNVMITRRGEVKLVDFGIAKAAESLERTRPGVVKGKFAYMSPEQLDQLPLDGRSDLFSVGATLYELTVGKRPFERENIIETIKAIADWTPPPPAEVVRNYPRLLSDVVMRALAKDRERRYANGKEMERALLGVTSVLPDSSHEQLALYLKQLARKQQALRRGASEAELAAIEQDVAPQLPKPSDAIELSGDELTGLLDRARDGLELADEHSRSTTVPGKKPSKAKSKPAPKALPDDDDEATVSAPDPFEIYDRSSDSDSALTADMPGVEKRELTGPTTSLEPDRGPVREWTGPTTTLAPDRGPIDPDFEGTSAMTVTATAGGLKRNWKPVAIALGLGAAVGLGGMLFFAHREPEAPEAPAGEKPAKAGQAPDQHQPVTTAVAREPDSRPQPETASISPGKPKRLGTAEFKGPKGLGVYLDGGDRRSCTTPCKLELAEGKHTARAPGGRARAFSVLSGKTVAVKLP